MPLFHKLGRIEIMVNFQWLTKAATALTLMSMVNVAAFVRAKCGTLFTLTFRVNAVGISQYARTGTCRFVTISASFSDC